jgi:mannose-6-phosphate isomerase-like protein (cupin superfamily)
LHIGLHCWHQLVNETSNPLTLIEIQYGSRCIEEDVERRL